MSGVHVDIGRCTGMDDGMVGWLGMGEALAVSLLSRTRCCLPLPCLSTGWTDYLLTVFQALLPRLHSILYCVRFYWSMVSRSETRLR